MSQAIESVLSQNMDDVEIIIVDDGSTDNTKAVALQYPVRYVYQQNQGLSAARNTGINNSSGKYLVFLDADDWLLPDALSINLQYLKENKACAFVSGGYQLWLEETQEYNVVQKKVEENHYHHFLFEGNYIGMHAAVMYRRWIFDTYRYNTSLKACEDYDLYLNISRKYPVFHHTELIATYRIHTSNMSGNIPKMLNTALETLGRQKNLLMNVDERKYFNEGIEYWKKYYCRLLYKKLLYPTAPASAIQKKEEEQSLRKNYPSLHFKYRIKKPIMPYRNFFKRFMPHYILRALHKAGAYRYFIPAKGKVVLGDFNRTTPFSRKFGFDRGGPVDRYYIENFLQKNEAAIHGRVLEIGDNEYTVAYGGEKVEKSDILHIDDTNPKATIVGDLSNAPDIPDNSFDCIILTQTLHLIYEYKKALETCYRILKPGGALLLTVPGIGHIDQGDWYKYWLWSFTDNSIKRLLSEIFPEGATTVEPFGNVLVATAFLYGMGLPEMKKKQMDYQDPHYQVIITASAIKPV